MIADTKSTRLLVVEDEIITARDLQDSLEELGYDVPDIASSGGEALDLAATLRPDIVLMDINLGASSRDGVEIARELRERFDVPVIYLTAYADAATLARAADTAPLGYLTKPFERRELHATIQMALVKRQLDEQLRQSENWYSTSLSSIGDGVIATDASGRVKFVNPVAEALIGWPHVEALGKPLAEIFPLFDRATGAGRTCLAERVLADKGTIFLEEGTMLRSRSGALIPLDDSAAPIRDQRDGKVLGVVVVFRDLSEKQQIAAELERARRLESLGTLAGGLAHDLNNILAIIAGNVSLANRADAPVELQSRAFAKIDTALRRAKALTGQFLTFSKGGEPIRRTVDVEALLNEEMELMLAEITASDASFESLFDLSPELWTVEADEGQIRRVVENLLRNAIQALPAVGGCITVRALNCAQDEVPALLAETPGEENSSESCFVKLEVSDNGCGITAEDLTHVCDPYFTTRTTGSGLGLSVCHSIARKHNGALRVQSVVGQGTTVTIYLPARKTAATERSQRSERSRHEKLRDGAAGIQSKPETGKKHLRVLVMDDEPLMRELLSRMLAYLGHTTTTAQTGEEALRLYEEATAKEPFDLVFIDLLNKIGMGGEEMMVRLQKMDPDVAAIVCSGYSDHPIMAKYRSFGFSACLPKPVTLEELQSGVEQAVKNPRVKQT